MLTRTDEARFYERVAPMMVCHRCDNPTCVNPAHLFIGTAKDNAQDRDAKGRRKNSRAKFTPDEVRDVRSRAQSGETAPNLAAEYGVHKTTVYNILRGDVYKNALGSVI